MNDKSYNGNLISLRQKDDLKGIQIILSKVDETLMKNIELALSQGKKSFGHNMVYHMKNIIAYGGTSGFGWTYWKRKRGEKEFKAITPVSPRKKFSWKFSYGSGSELTLPIHPRSYWALRKVRKKPINGQYALTDSGRMTNNIKVKSFVNRRTKIVTINVFTNSPDFKQKLLKHELGWQTDSGFVIRPVIKPSWQMSKKYVALNINSAMKQTTKDLERLSKGKS